MVRLGLFGRGDVVHRRLAAESGMDVADGMCTGAAGKAVRPC